MSEEPEGNEEEKEETELTLHSYVDDRDVSDLNLLFQNKEWRYALIERDMQSHITRCAIINNEADAIKAYKEHTSYYKHKNRNKIMPKYLNLYRFKEDIVQFFEDLDEIWLKAGSIRKYEVWKELSILSSNINLKNITAYRFNTFNTFNTFISEIFMDHIKNTLERDSTLIPIVLGEGESSREYYIVFDEKEVEQYEKKKLQNISKIKRKAIILQDESQTLTGEGIPKNSNVNSEGMDREKVKQKVKEIEKGFSLQEVFYLFDIIADFVPFRMLQHKYEERIEIKHGGEKKSCQN